MNLVYLICASWSSSNRLNVYGYSCCWDTFGSLRIKLYGVITGSRCALIISCHFKILEIEHPAYS